MIFSLGEGVKRPKKVLCVNRNHIVGSQGELLSEDSDVLHENQVALVF